MTETRVARPSSTQGSADAQKNSRLPSRAQSVVRTASIVQFMPGSIFDDAATKLMGDAFDTACDAVHHAGQPHVVYDILAKRIISVATKGEWDVTRLRDAALSALFSRRRPIE